MAQPGPSSLILSAAIILAASGAAEAAEPASPNRRTTAECQALVRGFPDLPNAPTRVTEARVASTGSLPPFCEVKATIRSQVGIGLRLPMTGWNGKFFQYGRERHCRPVTMHECDAALGKGYACVVSDNGNQTSLLDDEWSANDTEAKANCGFRGIHLATVAGKALTEAFYGQAPRFSYLMGCSSGGRYGLVEAQRFPSDYDGIIAGAPPASKSSVSLNLAWAAVSTLGPDGRSVLAAADINLLSEAVVARCDMTDGVRDGVVGDPFACRFDPAELQCRAAKTADCLSPAQVAAVRRIYQGPVDSSGRKLHPGGALPGSEAGWLGTYVAPDGGQSGVHKSMNGMFRFLATPPRRPDWDIRQLDWDKDPPTYDLSEAYNDASNPDLRRFRAHGGKLLIFHGLGDQAMTPPEVIDYYQAVERVTGGEAVTRDFARLFLVPGLNHCSGGPGASVIDYIAAIEAWVEEGRAPDSLIATRLKSMPTAAATPVPVIRPQDVVFTRPIYPFPLTARYKGVGPATQASSFQPVTSSAVRSTSGQGQP
jgi:hypothetical protein